MRSQTTPTPPAARRIPARRICHGDTFVDEFAWLADKDRPEVAGYLRAENTYTAVMTEAQATLRTSIFEEIKIRTKETDVSAPVRKGHWWYYTRTAESRQYPVRCRCPARPGEALPPAPQDGQLVRGEEVMLDGNELAGRAEFFSLGTVQASPDGRLLAYATDYLGNERFTLRVKDLVTGETEPDEIPDTYYGCAWSADASALFYITVDEAWRPYRIWRHLIGTAAAQDVIVFEEHDEKFLVSVGLSRSERYLVISSASELTSEVWLRDARSPEGEFSVVLPRRQGIEYHVEHQALPDGTDRLLILHNDGAVNFELAQAPASRPAQRTPLIGHRDDTRLLSVDAFADHIVVHFRRDGLPGLRIISSRGDEREIAFPEPIYQATPGMNPEYDSASFRLNYASMVTPDSVYDCDAATGELTLVKREPVLPGPDGTPFDPAAYEQHRVWATAEDGIRVPITLVCRTGTPRDGTAPFLLYGYGSYGISTDPSFSIQRLSLLDRGFGYAIAHVRGGGEMGRRWYDDGKQLHKINTFTDFVACARYLAREGWTAPGRLIARGRSAGGLLMGAVANLAPGAFGGIVAQVPFVDPLTDVLDPSLPLTITEWDEWRDPLHDRAAYQYMRSYSPYENVSPDAIYPRSWLSPA